MGSLVRKLHIGGEVVYVAERILTIGIHPVVVNRLLLQAGSSRHRIPAGGHRVAVELAVPAVPEFHPVVYCAGHVVPVDYRCGAGHGSVVRRPQAGGHRQDVDRQIIGIAIRIAVKISDGKVEDILN